MPKTFNEGSEHHYHIQEHFEEHILLDTQLY